MTTPKKVGIAAFLVICLGTIGYFLLGYEPPANPKAERIAFMGGSTPWVELGVFNYDIYVMNVEGPGLTRITWQADFDEMPTWSPQGDKIAYTRIDGLYMMNADGSGEPELLWQGSGRGTTLTPAWSPDGSKIAFSEGIIYILDVESRQAVRLTDGAISSDSPTWSPDGKRIAFTIRPFIRTPGGGPKGQIAVINTDGSGFTHLTDVGVDSSDSPCWSPDGKQIAFERGGSIFVMDADGTNERALARGGWNLSPTWSPDGTRIAFVSLRNSTCGTSLTDAPAFCTSELYVMNADGSNVRLLRSKRNEKIVYPAWAP
jgi:TolB protein